MTATPDSSAVPSGSATEAPQTNPGGGLVRVVSGSPTLEELAAVVAVLLAVSAAPPDEDPPSPSRWSSPATRLRTAYGPRRAGWRVSALPR